MVLEVVVLLVYWLLCVLTLYLLFLSHLAFFFLIRRLMQQISQINNIK